MKRKPPSLDTPYRRHRAVSEEEKALWLQAVEGKKHHSVNRAKAESQATTAVPAPETGRKKVPTSEEVPRKKKVKTLSSPEKVDSRTRSRIKRGALAIGATLDLHGFTVAVAHGELVRFLLQAQARGVRLALVITGKGKGGGQGGALRREFTRWLNESPLRECVIAYDNAGPRHGGQGAWYVRIRKGHGSGLGGQGVSGNISGSGF